jgi:uncharacterized glyoxalase superfamily protein PhnB
MPLASRSLGFTPETQSALYRAETRQSSSEEEPSHLSLRFTGCLPQNIDATYNELRSLGARIVEPLEKKPWGLRQFTVEDVDGNRFYFHCD